MKLTADLHLHTFHSDGLRSPEAVVRLAAKHKLGVIAISDHDNLAAIPEAQPIADELRIVLIPAIELSTSFDGQDVHLLAYGVDVANAELQAKLEEFRARRLRRGDVMVEQLIAHGIEISRERVEELRGDAALGRPHIGRALIEAGFVKTMDEAFDHYLSPGRPGYIETPRIALVDAIALTHRAGGIASLAHPVLNRGDVETARAAIDMGLDAIEVYHPRLELADRHRYLDLVRERKILVTGGSDDHGIEGRESMGSCRLDEPHVTRLLERMGISSQ